MTDGLNIGIKEFHKLPQKEQLTILYENTEQLKNMVRGYKLQLKVQYIWLFVLTIALGLGKYLTLF